MAMREYSQRWGRDIVPGAKVTTRGRHGQGQPALNGTVEAVDRDLVVIKLRNGVTRQRTISNVRCI